MICAPRPDHGFAARVTRGVASPVPESFSRQEVRRMDFFGWIVLGLACWAFGIFLAIVLMQVTGDQEEAERKGESGVPLKREKPGGKPSSRSETGDRR
jgi:hypothetical protein